MGMAMSERNTGLNLLLSFCFLTAFVFLLAAGLFSRPTMVFLFAHTSFFLIAALCGLWVYWVAASLSGSDFNLLAFIRAYRIGILLSIGMTAVVFWSVPVCFKMLNDETNLLAVSQSMFYFRDTFRIASAENYHGVLHTVVNEIPIRPLLFPFSTFLLHVITGYDWHNPFVLNFLIMFVFLSGIYIVSRHHVDVWSACAAVLLVCSYPVFTVYGTSGSYDLFSAFFFFLSMVMLYRFLETPDDTGFALLWTTLVMLANIRYESILFFVLIIPPVLLIHGTRFLRKNVYIYAATPILMLPYFWQMILSTGKYENPPGIPLFSFQAFYIHIKLLIKNFLNLNFFLPYNGMLNIAVVICAGFLISRILQKKIVLTKNHLFFWGIFIVSLLAMLTIVLSHFIGLYNHPNQARLFLCFSIICALAPILIQCAAPGLISGRTLFAVSVTLFMLYHPVASRHEFINTLLTTRIQHQSWQILQEYNPEEVLILSAWSGQYSARNYSSLSIQYANSHVPEIRQTYRNHGYKKIILFQEIKASTKAPRYANQALSMIFKTKIIQSFEVIPGEILRVSEVFM